MNILLILLVSMFVFANDFTFNKDSGQAVPNYCGEIKMFRGGVFKENNGQLTPVKEGTRFYKNDKIVTEAKSFAKILMIDDSTIQLGANSEIRISEFQYNSKTDRKMVIAMIRGQLRSLIKNKAKEGDLEIKTKLAVMGIRGTELLINHQELKNISVSEFGLLEGQVDISNLKNEKFKLNPQNKLTIVQDNNSKNEVSDSQSFLEDEKKSLVKEEAFMALFLPEKVLPASPVYPLIHASSASQSNAPTGQLPEAQQEKKSSLNWQENLKKLNEKLKENQKKR
jgi:hypothetical protein